MFKKFIKELSEATADEKQISEGDFLGPGSGLNPSPAPSMRPSEGKLSPSSSMSSLRASPNRRGPWSSLVTGARKLIDAMNDFVDIDDDDDSERGLHSRHASSISGVSDSAILGTGLEKPQESDVILLLGSKTEPLPLRDTAMDIVEFPIPSTSEPSGLLSENDIQGISSHMPIRHRQKSWNLLYSTQRDGISMKTMLRKCSNWAPTVLIVRDMSKHVFGAFCSEPWKISNRYYGTGETFVFKVSPKAAVWHWWYKKSQEIQNDYFMWGSNEAIAVGGAGGYAIWLDNELCHGISRSSLTFGNESLSNEEEFLIGAVELWGLA